jgi:hypothetical protein
MRLKSGRIAGGLDYPVSIGPNAEHISYVVGDSHPMFFSAVEERTEIAEMMIERWQRWASVDLAPNQTTSFTPAEMIVLRRIITHYFPREDVLGAITMVGGFIELNTVDPRGVVNLADKIEGRKTK